MPNQTKTKIYLLLVLLLLGVSVLLWSEESSLAQGEQTIRLNERKVGQITATNPRPSYRFDAIEGQEVLIDITALSPQLALSFTVFNQNGALLVAVGNPSLQAQIADSLIFPATGAYTIQINNVSDVDGEFILSVLQPEMSVPALPLLPGQPITNQLEFEEIHLYRFSGASEVPLILEIRTETTTLGLNLSLTNDTGETLAQISSVLLGGQLVIPSGQQEYLLRVSNDHLSRVNIRYQISLRPNALTTSSPTQTPSPTATVQLLPTNTRQILPTSTPDPNQPPELPTSGPCKLATQGQIVNVRAGPSTRYDVIGTIGAFRLYDVLGRNETNDWLQINAQPEVGWVARNVTRQGGDCDATDIAIASYPPLPSSISGLVWSDLCEGGNDPDDLATPPVGCVLISDGTSLRANGFLDGGEPGIGGIEVVLSTGACPGTLFATRITDSAGNFFFNDLVPMTYCISINPNSPANVNVLMAGWWTQPNLVNNASGPARINISLLAGEDYTYNFGWDYAP
jgi:hypothetical protein